MKRVDLVVLDQSIDTGSSTGRLLSVCWPPSVNSSATSSRSASPRVSLKPPASAEHQISRRKLVRFTSSGEGSFGSKRVGGTPSYDATEGTAEMRRADTHGRSRLAHDVGHSVRFRAPSSFGRSETSPGYDPDVPQDAIVLTTVKTKPAAARRGPVLTAAARDGGHVVQAGTRRCLGRTRRCDERKYQEAPGRRPILGG